MTPVVAVTPVVAAALAAAAIWVLAGGPGLGSPPWVTRTAARASASIRRLGPRTRRRPRTGELLGSLAGELAAGQPLASALETAAAELAPCPCPLALRAARSGGNVPAALRADAANSGSVDLSALAVCWEVALATGSGLAASVDRLAAASRASAAARGELRAELAATRASAKLLLGLPLLGIAMGIWIGADPLGWFLSASLGRVVLVAGLGLQVAAWFWLRRITKQALSGIGERL